MREILFRGQTRRKGEKVRMDGSQVESNWVYGGIFQGPNYSVIYGYDPIEKYCVYSDTVGQFTGLTDKNGKKIFEGDIVHVLGNQQVDDWKNVNYIGSIAFLDAGFCVIDGTIEDHAFRRYQLPRLDFDLEVIGNIHDNPELLEVGNA